MKSKPLFISNEKINLKFGNIASVGEKPRPSASYSYHNMNHFNWFISYLMTLNLIFLVMLRSNSQHCLCLSDPILFYYLSRINIKTLLQVSPFLININLYSREVEMSLLSKYLTQKRRCEKHFCSVGLSMMCVKVSLTVTISEIYKLMIATHKGKRTALQVFNNSLQYQSKN